VFKVKNDYWLFFGGEQVAVRWKSETFGVDIAKSKTLYSEKPDSPQGRYFYSARKQNLIL